MINPNLNPWNVYGNFDKPDMSTTANVYADNHEWYNSYMPPFFLLKDKKIIKQIRLELDNGNSIKKVFFESMSSIERIRRSHSWESGHNGGAI